MPVNNQSGDESGQSNSTVNVLIPGIIQRLERAAARAGESSLACSDQCLFLLRRQGINASQFVAKITPAASKHAPIKINPFKCNKGKQNPAGNKAETRVLLVKELFFRD